MRSFQRAPLPLILVIFGVHIQVAHGACSGTARACNTIYPAINCNGDDVCDAAFGTCESFCERNGVEEYNSPCQCNKESLGCDDGGCNHRITCDGFAVCEDLANSLDCSVTRGCKWTPSPATVPDDSATTDMPSIDLVDIPVATPIPPTLYDTWLPTVDTTMEETPTFDNGMSPTIHQCNTNYGNDDETCAELLATTSQICDCYSFCDDDLVLCDVFGEEQPSYLCTGTVVLGCTLQQGTLMPTPESSMDGSLSLEDAQARTEQIRTYLIDEGISSEEDLTTEDSPQQLALTFMAVDDGMQMAVPEGNKMTLEGYEFMSRYVVATLFYSTGLNWNFDLNFLEPTDVCLWYSVLQYVDLSQELRGVVCDQDTGELVGFFMKQNNLQGTLPEELGLLTTINNIDFDQNNLIGSIPDSFQGLTNMENLFVSGSQFSGEFPSWIDQWTNLRNINLSHNLFGGSLPASIGYLEELEGIALDNNLFTGTLEGIFDTSVIPGLRKLEQFYAENNQFTGVIEESFLRDLTNLTHLDISDNQIGGNVSMHLFEFQQLLILDLHDNDFDFLPDEIPENSAMGMLALQKCKFANQPVPASVSNLVSLQHLDLSQNEFIGFIPPQIGSMTNLTYLFLAQNNFEPAPIPSWVSGLRQLEELSLKSTSRTGTIPFDLGNNLQGLVLLDLDNNMLEGKIPETLGYLSGLHILTLNRNNLTSTIPETFAGLSSLKLIFLEANTQITGNLGDLYCGNPMKLKPVITADCDLCDGLDDCCMMCCENGQECNDGIYVPDLDPIWQLGYQRVFFTFRRDDYFEKEIAPDDDRYTGTGDDSTDPPDDDTTTTEATSKTMQGGRPPWRKLSNLML